MASYRYLVYSALGSPPTFLGELPLTGVSWSQKLNSFGSVTATLTLDPPSNVLPSGSGAGRFGADQYGTTFGDTATATYGDTSPIPVGRILKAMAEPMRAALWIERDGVLVWGGPIIARRYSTSSRTVQISANEWWWYWGLRLAIDPSISEEYSIGYYQLDLPGLFVRDSIAAIAGSPQLAVITNVTGPTDVIFDLWRYQARTLADVQAEFCAIPTGGDFGIDVAWSAGAPLATLSSALPRGRNAAGTNLVFELGQNLLLLDTTEDGTVMSNYGLAAGAGSGTSMLTSYQARMDSVAAGYPAMFSTPTWKDATVQSQLDGRLSAWLDARAYPAALFDAVVTGGPEPSVASYITGDWCRLRVPAGIDPYWPDGLDVPQRIIGRDVKVDDNGWETVTLTLGTS